MDGVPEQQDVYVSPYFGDVPGRVIGIRLDSAFEQFQERIQNPGRVPYPIDIQGSTTIKSSGFPWLLLVAAAAAFALS